MQCYNQTPSRCRDVKALHGQGALSSKTPRARRSLPDCRIAVGSHTFLREAREAELHRDRQRIEVQNLYAQGIGQGRCPFVKLLHLEPGSQPFIHAGATQECIQPKQALFGLALVLAKYAECETLNPQRLANPYFNEIDDDLVSSLSQLRRSPARRRCGFDDRIASWKIPDHGRHRTSNRTHTATEQPR
jgi:hypothetical protein